MNSEAPSQFMAQLREGKHYETDGSSRRRQRCRWRGASKAENLVGLRYRKRRMEGGNRFTQSRCGFDSPAVEVKTQSLIKAEDGLEKVQTLRNI